MTELKDIERGIWFTLILIVFAMFACTWIILEGAHNRNKAVLKSIGGLRSEVVELQAALEKHDTKLEWWERE